MNKKTSIIIFGLILSTILLVNFFVLYLPFNKIIKQDERNKGISVIPHYEYFVNPSVLVYDLRSIASDKSMMDVFRVLLEYSEQMKTHHFNHVILSVKGTSKFVIKGEFFNTTGMEYGTQNPMYTIRTFPENLYKINGEQAFQTWEGGMLGVLSKQMEDFSSFHHEWYFKEISEK
jgi:hypothetical protein